MAKDKDYDIAYDFATKAYKKFRDVVKAIVLFGSVSKKLAGSKSDIDIIVIIDDCTVQWDQELIAWYREELAKLIERQKYSRKLHVNTVTLTAFWDELRAGEPVVINVVRYGQSLIDVGGFFDPLKVLLAKGKIRPSAEAVFNTLKRGPLHIAKAKYSVMSSVDNLYWAMVDSAHAALMASGEIPPSPEHLSVMLERVFVSKRKLDKKYVLWYEELHKLAKDIVHGTKVEVSGKEIDFHTSRAVEFEKKLRNMAYSLIEDERITMLKKRKK